MPEAPRALRRLLAAVSIALMLLVAVPTFADDSTDDAWSSLWSWVESMLGFDEDPSPEATPSSDPPPEDPGTGPDTEDGPYVDPGG